MAKVSIRELKNKLSEYVDRASRGEQIVVTKRGKAVATVNAAPKREETLEEKLDRLAAAGIISSGGGKPRLPERTYRLRGNGPTMSEMIIEDRR